MDMTENKLQFPKKAKTKEELLAFVKENKRKDVQWRKGKAFCLVYHPGDERASMIKEIYDQYYSDNALNPGATPSLTKMESQVIAMCADLFHGDDQVRGNITSGGTESILLAVKSARDWAKKHKPNIKNPEVIVPASVHPAFIKGFQYFGVQFKSVPLKNYRADPAAIENEINENTILLVASAPSYPHGLMDPVSEISELAFKNDILCHVDSCIGGFLLPFIKKLGYPIPEFDFNLRGVTSISADLHKFGYAPKGSSVILYRNADLRKFQFSVYTKWNGGVYGSPTIGGTRPGGCIAGSWAAINGIGEEGYLDMAEVTMSTSQKLIDGVKLIEELSIIEQPEMSIFSFQSEQLNVYQLADLLNKKGWHFERQHLPPSLHFTVNYIHKDIVDEFLTDLNTCVQEVQKFNLSKIGDKLQVGLVKGLKKVLPKGTISKFQKTQSSSDDIHKENTAPMYGMMNVLSGTDDLDEIVLDFMDKINTLDPS